MKLYANARCNIKDLLKLSIQTLAGVHCDENNQIFSDKLLMSGYLD